MTAITSETPIKSWVNSVIKYFKNVAVSIAVDPMSGQPSLDIRGYNSRDELTLSQVFSALKKLSQDYEVLIVFEEFQDIAAIKQAGSLMREHLQEMNKNPVIILGSKRKLLEKMFASNKSPFFSYGQEMHLNSISLKHWLPYFNGRLKQVGSTISEDTLEKLLAVMCDVPNAICEAGSWFMSHGKKQDIDDKVMFQLLNQLIDSKEQSLRFQISLLSTSERSVFKEIARLRYAEKITAGSFLKAIQPSASSTQKIVSRLEREGFLEWEFEKGYRLADPMLAYFVNHRAI